MRTWLNRLREGKYSAYILVAIFAAILLLALSFYWREEPSGGSATEKRLEQIISRIEGVGDLQIMVNETEEEVLGVIVVCEGADRLSVRLDVLDAVSTALGISRGSIQIYEMK